MNTRALKAHRSKLVSVVLGAVVAVPAGASAAMPVLPDAQALAGGWRLSDGSGRPACRVDLSATPAPGGWRLEAERACLEAFLPHAAAWRPEPDGVAFTASDRRTLAFFAKVGANAYAYARPDGVKLKLTREPG